MRAVYWDSDCFLAWLQNEAGKADKCAAVLDEAEEGKIRIVTSALTIAEVLAVPRREKIPRNRRQEVEAFFQREFIVIRGLTGRLGTSARELVWDRGIAPKDAVHVATALDAKLSELHTFDGGLIGHSQKLGDPPLWIGTPYVAQAKLFTS